MAREKTEAVVLRDDTLLVELPKWACFQCATEGCQRRLLGMWRNRSEPFGTPQADLWGNDVESTCAEYAFESATGRPVIHKSVATPGDIHGGIEVRSTHHLDGHLMLHPNDSDDAPFALVVGVVPRFWVVGWVFGGEGKREEWWDTGLRKPAFMVPQSELRPASNLRVSRIIRQQAT